MNQTNAKPYLVQCCPKADIGVESGSDEIVILIVDSE